MLTPSIIFTANSKEVVQVYALASSSMFLTCVSMAVMTSLPLVAQVIQLMGLDVQFLQHHLVSLEIVILTVRLAIAQACLPSEVLILLALTMLTLVVCLLYTSPSPRDRQKSRMPSSA